MRTDAIELGTKDMMGTRRKTERSSRSGANIRRNSTHQNEAPAVDAIDEAFAGLPIYSAITTRVDTPQAGQLAGDAAARRPMNFGVVKQLAAQLDALDRQREQLAQLLREIEDAPLAD